VLEVLKEGGVVDKVCLEKKRALFGRQALMCDYVLDHPSVSRQHAAVVQHKNGRQVVLVVSNSLLLWFLQLLLSVESKKWVNCSAQDRQ
jgi:pSer/pThr/pTyr-binding forkhead associated (FHA) protein